MKKLIVLYLLSFAFNSSSYSAGPEVVLLTCEQDKVSSLYIMKHGQVKYGDKRIDQELSFDHYKELVLAKLKKFEYSYDVLKKAFSEVDTFYTMVDYKLQNPDLSRHKRYRVCTNADDPILSVLADGTGNRFKVDAKYYEQLNDFEKFSFALRTVLLEYSLRTKTNLTYDKASRLTSLLLDSIDTLNPDVDTFFSANEKDMLDEATIIFSNNLKNSRSSFDYYNQIDNPVIRIESGMLITLDIKRNQLAPYQIMDQLRYQGNHHVELSGVELVSFVAGGFIVGATLAGTILANLFSYTKDFGIVVPQNVKNLKNFTVGGLSAGVGVAGGAGIVYLTRAAINKLVNRHIEKEIRLLEQSFTCLQGLSCQGGKRLSEVYEKVQLKDPKVTQKDLAKKILSMSENNEFHRSKSKYLKYRKMKALIISQF